MPDTNAVIVILTALPVEYAAVRDELRIVGTSKHESGTRFEEGFLKGTHWRIFEAVGLLCAGNPAATAPRGFAVSHGRVDHVAGQGGA